MQLDRTPLDVATSYLDRGWPVFPCRAADEEAVDRITGQTKYDPETGEVEILKVKTPITDNGFKAATKFRHIIERWWKDNPDAMIGVPTGDKIGAWVLDVDPRHDGHETLAALEQEYGELPATLTATTASGGKHYYFRHVQGVRNRGNLGPGIDVRGDGGYVIAPGSVTAAGGRYEWDNDLQPVPAPQWLLDPVVRKAPTTTVTAPSGQVTNSAYVNAAVDRELADLASTGMGSRNNALNDASFALGQFVGAGALPESEARALLQDVAKGWGRDWARCCKTIENGLAAGIRTPREIPSVQHDDDNTRLVDISKMIENGLRKAREKAGKPAKEAANQIRENPVIGKNIEQNQQDTCVSQPAKTSANDNTAAPQPALIATAFKWKDPRKLPRREFAYGTHYIRKYVSVTVAPGGLGKTSNSIVEALSMAAGRDLVGVKPPTRLKTWIFNSEDPRDELERRIMGACIYYKLKPEDVDGHLFLDTGREQELVIAVEDKKTGVRIIEPIVEAIVEQINTLGIDVMIVDPFVSTHAVNESDNGAIDKVAKLWAQIADKTNCAVDIVHHLRKTGDREATVEDARGAVALLGAARSVRVLNRMDAEDAKAVGIKDDDRFGYFNIYQGKANLTKQAAHKDWRHMESVPLGNGGGLQQPQDHAGVVTYWKFPGAEEIVEGISMEQRDRLASLLAGQSYKLAAQGKPWAGEAVMAAMDMDPDDKGSVKVAGSILRALIKEGVLRLDERRDEKSRTMQKFVVAA